MDLTVKDAARLLNVSEKTIHRWLKEGKLPNHRVRDKCRFNRVELLEWASSQQLTVSPEPFRGDSGSAGLSAQHGSAGASPSLLTDALRRGGVIHDLAGTDKSSALKAVCDVLPLPDGSRRDELYEVLVAREALCSTGIGNGIAIPHPRGPIVLGLHHPSVTLAFLRQPIEFGALDARPVTTLFVIISTTVRVHLMMLSHLMFALQNKEFRRLVEVRASQAELLAKLEQVETGMVRIPARRNPEGAES